MIKTKELKVNAIKNGTVIDHIPADHLFKVISILGLDTIENQITFGTNLESDRLGHKAIIKVSDKYFEDEEINKISLFAPTAKLNIIKDFEVVEKKVVKIPNEVYGFVKCFNPMCITNNERVKTRFTLVDKENVALKCHYCEKVTTEEHLHIV